MMGVSSSLDGTLSFLQSAAVLLSTAGAIDSQQMSPASIVTTLQAGRGSTMIFLAQPRV
jgi:hypothetical protein